MTALERRRRYLHAVIQTLELLECFASAEPFRAELCALVARGDG